MSVDPETFNKAVAHVAQPGGPPQSNDTKLFFYAHYKQATEGDNTRDAPSMFNFVAKSKHDAWDKLRGMSKDKARELYVAKLLQVDARFKPPQSKPAMPLAAPASSPSAAAPLASPSPKLKSVGGASPPSSPSRSAAQNLNKKDILALAMPAGAAAATTSSAPAAVAAAVASPATSEKPKFPPGSLDRVFTRIFVDSGAFRTFLINFVLVYNVRFLLALVVRLTTLARSSPRSLLSLSEILSEKHMHFREEAVRMGLFVGSFSGLYIALRRAFATPEEDTTRPASWNRALLSGTVAGGLSLLWMEQSWHRTLSLYMATRWVQCAYNYSKSRGYFHFWGSSWQHGDSLLFALSSAQIMYSYVMRPGALPPSYYAFIRKQGPLDEVVLQAVRDNCRQKPVDTQALFALVQAKGGAEALGQVMACFPPGAGAPFPRVVPKRALHPHTRYSAVSAAQAFWGVSKQIFGVYLSLALVPAVVLRFQHFLKRPGTVLLHSLQSALQSTLFLSTFCGGYQAFVCVQRDFLDALQLPDHRAWYYVAGLVSSLAIFIERKSRRSELALYAFPRAADALWAMLYDRKLMIRVPQGEIILFAMAMGGLCAFHELERAAMSPLVVKVLERFIPDDVLYASSSRRARHHDVMVATRDGTEMRKNLESMEFGELRSDTPRFVEDAA